MKTRQKQLSKKQRANDEWQQLIDELENRIDHICYLHCIYPNEQEFLYRKEGISQALTMVRRYAAKARKGRK